MADEKNQETEAITYEETEFDDNDVFKIGDKEIKWKDIKEFVDKEINNSGDDKAQSQSDEKPESSGEKSDGKADSPDNTGEKENSQKQQMPQDFNQFVAIQFENKISNTRQLYKLYKGLDIPKEVFYEKINEKAKKGEQVTFDDVDAVAEEYFKQYEEKNKKEKEEKEKIQKEPYMFGSGSGDTAGSSNSQENLKNLNPLDVMNSFENFRKTLKR